MAKKVRTRESGCQQPRPASKAASGAESGQEKGLRDGAVVELEVSGLSPDGRGVARHEGMVVFTAGAVPGDRVAAWISNLKKRFAEAEVREVLTPSPDRVEPWCRHFKECGGCPLMHLDYRAQLHWKKQFAADALNRIGRVGIEPADCIPSPVTSGHRNKMEFAFGIGPNRRILLGLRKAGSNAVFDLEECPACAPESVQIVAAVRDLVRDISSRTGLECWNPRNRKGAWRHLNIRTSAFSGKAAVQLITAPGREADAAAGEVGALLMDRFESVSSFVHSVRKSRSMTAAGEQIQLMLGEQALEERLGDVRYRISPDAFFQTNTGGAHALYETAASMLLGGIRNPATAEVADLYSGTGGVALYIAGQVGRVVGYEIHPGAVGDAESNAELNRFRNASFRLGDVAGTFVRDSAGRPPGAVVCDPPRAGMDQEVAEAILKAGPENVVAISCNPATLGRDVARLSEGYRAVEAVPVDMFPHTGHVECVVRFEKL